MLCRIWGPNEAANTPGSRPLWQLGGEDSEQYRAMRRLVPAFFFFFFKKKKVQNGAVLIKIGISLPIFNLVLRLSISFNIIP
jgi:hypothetical protein